MSQPTFTEYLAERNLRSARFVSLMVVILMPTGVTLDWFVHRDQVAYFFALRLASAAVAAACYWLSLRRAAVDSAYPLGLVPLLGVAVAIELMMQRLGGYASSYYMGLIHALFALGVVFQWPLGRALLACVLVLGVWLGPALAQSSELELTQFVNNFYALLVAAAIAAASNGSRFASVRREYAARSDLVQALDRLKELDRLKSEFFSNVTHELRTPLTTILSPLESLLAGEMGGLHERQKRYLLPIHRSALKLLRLINDLLDLAKIEERYMRLRIEPTDLSGLLGEIVEHATPLAARKGVELSLELRKPCEAAYVDAEQMERVVVNLLSNALKFTDRGGEVTVWLDVVDGEALVGVTDTGIGVSEDQKEWIFERFRQADGSTTRRYGGTGIGLALAKDIVDLHGGRISVKSNLGQGSEFVVHLKAGPGRLPYDVIDRRKGAASSPEQRRSDDHEPQEWTQRLLVSKEYRFLQVQEVVERRAVERCVDSGKATRILVVEDNVEVLRFVAMQLQEQHAVYVASDGTKGLELARRELPDVIVTDYMMPGMDGLAMLRAIRDDPRTADIPAIMLTAKNQVADRLDAREAGADVYLAKPFSPPELRAAVAQLLKRRGRQVSVVMREQVKSLEIISAGLAHEIHNPLSRVKTALFVIDEKVRALEAAALNTPTECDELGQKVREARERIGQMWEVARKGIDRIEQVVQVVKGYAEEGRPRELTPVRIDKMLAGLAPLVSAADGRPQHVQLDLGAGEAEVLGIPAEIEQVFRNLWSNAADATGDSGHVWTRSWCDGASVLVEVADDGQGMAPEVVQRIFTPFFTTKDPGKGMGLGLAIAHHVVTQSGGEIDVSSVAGEGTRFRVRLPMSSDRSSYP